jgi:hypothetical protein
MHLPFFGCHDRRRSIHAGLLLVVLLVAGTGCTDTLVGDASSDDPRAVFDAYWSEFDRYYSFFPLKGLNWDSVRAVHAPSVTDATTDAELFAVLAEMTATLRDGHASLHTPRSDYRYTGWYTAYPEHFDPQRLARTVTDQRRVSSVVTRGTLPGNVGYLRVASFGADASAYAALDQVVAAMGERSGIVIDVRNNGGGSDQRGRQVARPFVTMAATFGWVRWRNGPAHDAFTDFQPRAVAPDADAPFDRPVAVVTNRRCFSTCESFVNLMRSQPHVTVVGDTTGGGSGSPVLRDLPNGWLIRVPRWIEYTADRIPYEERGLFPDVPVGLAAEDTADTMLLRAAEELTGADRVAGR